MKTPGSLYSVAPFTINAIDNNVLPHPGPPQTSVGLPDGIPPSAISSKPSISVGV